ncbi:MAG TPA: efflux RND transporter periplasmic adaptor subunit [Bryobacteraceae bacterium]|nr:efflux RND transporter periplasmic adaptor subunit [Bryobacteraceae bacterium]
MMRGKSLIVAGLLVCAALAAAVFFTLRRTAHPAPAGATPQPAPVPAEIVLPAQIRAQHVVPVPVPVEGSIETLLVEVGEQVYEGQLLGRIRNTALEADQQSAASELERLQTRLNQLESQLILTRADASSARSDAARLQAELERAQRAYQRQQMLFKEGATPRLVYEKSATDYEAAKRASDTASDLARGAGERLEAATRNVDAARRQAADVNATLDRARAAAEAAEIHSPVTGLVVGRTHRAGDDVTPDVQDLFRIASDVTALEAVIDPPAPVLGHIRAGQEAVLTVAETPDPVVAPVAEVQGSQVLVRFTSPSPAVRPGSTAQVRIKVR